MEKVKLIIMDELREDALAIHEKRPDLIDILSDEDGVLTCLVDPRCIFLMGEPLEDWEE